MRTTVILGQNGVGKTTLAEKMCNECGFALYSPHDFINMNLFSMDNADNTIIVDDVTIRDIPLLGGIITSNTITIHKPYLKNRVVSRPDIIIIASEGITKSDFGDMDVFFIELSKNKSAVAKDLNKQYTKRMVTETEQITLK